MSHFSKIATFLTVGEEVSEFVGLRTCREMNILISQLSNVRRQIKELGYTDLPHMLYAKEVNKGSTEIELASKELGNVRSSISRLEAHIVESKKKHKHREIATELDIRIQQLRMVRNRIDNLTSVEEVISETEDNSVFGEFDKNECMNGLIEDFIVPEEAQKLVCGIFTGLSSTRTPIKENEEEEFQQWTGKEFACTVIQYCKRIKRCDNTSTQHGMLQDLLAISMEFRKEFTSRDI